MLSCDCRMPRELDDICAIGFVGNAHKVLVRLYIVNRVMLEKSSLNSTRQSQDIYRPLHHNQQLHCPGVDQDDLVAIFSYVRLWTRFFASRMSAIHSQYSKQVLLSLFPILFISLLCQFDLMQSNMLYLNLSPASWFPALHDWNYDVEYQPIGLGRCPIGHLVANLRHFSPL